MGCARSFHCGYKRLLLKISLVLILVVQSACQTVPPSPAPASATPTPTLTATVCPSGYDPYPPPGCIPTAAVASAYPFPQPAATSTFFASPTLTPTPPLIIPAIASLTPTPANLTLANLLPAHSQYLSGVVADLGPGGSPAVAAVSRGPIGMVGDSPDISQAVFHLSIQPLTSATFALPWPDPKARSRLRQWTWIKTASANWCCVRRGTKPTWCSNPPGWKPGRA